MWKLVERSGFHPGVPNRDLTDDEMDAADALVPGLRESGRYEHSPDSEHPVLSRRAREAAELERTGAVVSTAPPEAFGSPAFVLADHGLEAPGEPLDPAEIDTQVGPPSTGAGTDDDEDSD